MRPTPKPVTDLSIPLREELKPPQSPIARQFLRSWLTSSHEIMISGPRNSAKTLLILWYLLNHHRHVPRLKSAVIRFEHKSISSTVLRTLRDKILRYPFGDPRNPFVLYGGENRPEAIYFRNGGQMDFRGLDGKGKALGAEYDLIFVNQAEQETRPRVWGDILGTIVGGRGGNWMYGGKRRWQVVADANPSSPHHFLYQRKQDGKIDWLDFTHKENPLFYDWPSETWTDRGRDTVESLKQSYNGFDYARMVEGKWVAAEGLVYPQFSHDLHVKPLRRNDFPSGTRWYASIDWGGTSLTAVGIYAVVGQASDRHYYLFKEICQSQAMVSEILAQLDAVMVAYDIPAFETVYVDHNAEHVLQCRQHGLPVQLADKSVLEGIETVRRIIKENRLTVNAASLEERDMNALDKPQGLVEELRSYAYPTETRRTQSLRDEYPIKENDHSCDQLRYVLHSLENRGGYTLDVQPFVVKVR